MNKILGVLVLLSFVNFASAEELSADEVGVCGQHLQQLGFTIKEIVARSNDSYLVTWKDFNVFVETYLYLEWGPKSEVTRVVIKDPGWVVFGAQKDDRYMLISHPKSSKGGCGEGAPVMFDVVKKTK